VIALPATWRRTSDPDRGVLVAARGPVAGPSGVVPLVRLEVCPVTGTLPAWRERDLRVVTSRRADFELEDEDDYELGDHAVSYRRFGYRRGSDDLVCEQWAWLIERCGYTLTGTVGRADHADYGELFEAVASSFSPPLCSPSRALSSRSATA
jgi:hypothetical protein